MMRLPDNVGEVLRKFATTYWHPQRRKLSPSEVYALHPEDFQLANDLYHWPNGWPGGSDPGVYLIYGGEMQLLYVGKADCLARRLIVGTFWLRQGRVAPMPNASDLVEDSPSICRHSFCRAGPSGSVT